ncbi:17800_t:CDS:2, partial [Funneliformis geosporum]
SFENPNNAITKKQLEKMTNTSDNVLDFDDKKSQLLKKKKVKNI